MPKPMVRVSGTSRVLAMFGLAAKKFSHADSWRVHADDAEYAFYVEVGTSSHRAQPYLGPATQSVKARLPEILDRANDLDDALGIIAKEIEKEAKERCPVDTGHLQASITAEKVK